MKIAVDAMGGDFAPLEIVLGSIAAVHEYKHMEVVLVGDESKIKEILKKNKVPIIVGGTGLYVNSLIYNIHYNEIKTDLEYRKTLENIDVEELYKMAEEIDSIALKKMPFR